MKNLSLSFLFILLFFSCSSDDEIINIPNDNEEVEILLNYTLLKEGSMTKSMDLYSDFYNKYIETRKLTPRQYEISFKKMDESDSLVVKGYWENKDFIKLKEGKYKVKGISYPINSTKKGTAQYIAQDTVSLSFDEVVTITKDMDNLTLKANYNCFMLLFDNQNISDVFFDKKIHPNISAYKLDNVFYMFVRNKKTLDDICIVHGSPLYIKRIDNTISELWLNKFIMEIGKYYLFEDVNGSYQLHPMENGY